MAQQVSGCGFVDPARLAQPFTTQWKLYSAIAPRRVDLKSSVAGPSKDRKSSTTDTLWKPSVITPVVGLGIKPNLE